MKKRKHHSKILLVVIFFTSFYSEAQLPYQYKISLDTIKQNGFYKITLLPEIVAKSREDFSDIRIADENSKFIPYVLKSDLPVFSSNNFIEFPTVSNEKLKDSSSEIIIANQANNSINSLLLDFKNFNAYRTATLSGSDDKQKWFVIKENILLEEANSNTNDQNLQSISFPLSNYKFFKIIINDKGLLPVNFLKAGVLTNGFTYGKYLPVRDPLIKQKDSNNKHSYINILFNDYYEIDRINIKVKGPPYYKRSAIIYSIINANRYQLAAVEISSSENIFTIRGGKSKNLLIDIFNKDDEPLTVMQVLAFQINQYIIAYLQADKNYFLLTGDSIAVAPEYDLKYFADSLNNDLVEIKTGVIEKKLPAIKLPAEKNKNSTIWLWVIIAIVLLLLCTLSFSMINKISKKDNDDRV